jgi:hypothetical protein
VDGQLDRRPVVEPGAADRLGIDAEGDRPDEVEAGAGGGAEPGDVAGVGRDLGGDEDDLQRRGDAGTA